MSTRTSADDTPPHGLPVTVVEGPQRMRVTRARARARTSRPTVSGAVFDSRGRRRSRLTRRAWLLVCALAALLLAVGVFVWYEVEADPSGTPGRPVLIDIRSGESTGSVLAQLTAEGVIGSSLAYELWMLLHARPTILPGHYLVHRNLSFAALTSVLEAGPNVFDLGVQPGLTLSEIASQLSHLPGDLANPFLQAARHGAVRSPFQPAAGATLEGLVGDGTYRIFPGETARQLLTQMVERFDAQAKAAGLTPSTTVGGLDAYQIVTLASIAQKEGYYDRYLGDVARVIYNRLGAGTALDMTSTVLYALGIDGGSPTPAEEQTTSPYNTYLHTGLTPTPICVPSERALAAAVSPPPGTWLYFELVTPKKGVMVFSSTFSSQLAAENEAALNAAARQSGSG